MIETRDTIKLYKKESKTIAHYLTLQQVNVIVIIMLFTHQKIVTQYSEMMRKSKVEVEVPMS